MVKFLIALLCLLVICVVVGIIRVLSGGTFLPRPEVVDGRPEPQSLKDLVERNRREKQRPRT